MNLVHSIVPGHGQKNEYGKAGGAHGIDPSPVTMTSRLTSQLVTRGASDCLPEYAKQVICQPVPARSDSFFRHRVGTRTRESHRHHHSLDPCEAGSKVPKASNVERKRSNSLGNRSRINCFGATWETLFINPRHQDIVRRKRVYISM